MKIRLPFIAVLFFSLNASVTNAQQQPGKKDSLQSTILGEKRLIQVVLPEQYKSGLTDKYDVLYVLDGDDNTRTAADVAHFIENHGQMPPVIIVGVINTDRTRDLTPTHSNDNATSGGAAKFLAFLKNELVPYINKNYPSNSDNILFGHSFGGLFATYALLNEPQVFESYIAADPSFWWDNRVMNKMTVDKLPSLANLNRTVYISGRDGEPYVGMGIVSMDSIFKLKAPAGFNWKDLAYAGETHGSVRLKTMYDGLRFIYAGYGGQRVVFHPMNGSVLKGKPFKIWFFDDTTKTRYTIDGTEPTLASSKIGKEITVAGPGKFIAKHFSNREKFNKSATGDFKESPVWPALQKVKNIKPGGFKYSYYEGAWDKLPDFKTLKPVKTGITDSSFSIDKLPRKENFGVVIEGYVEVKDEGYYLFGIDSDDGSKLYLNNRMIIDDDGLHGTDDGRSYLAPLQKGFYPLRLEYFQKDGGRNLTLKYIPAPMEHPNPISIPLQLQYSSN